MIKAECLLGCRYWGPLNGFDGSGGKCCNYGWITGKCRTTLPPRADGLCPGYEAGPRAKANPKRHDKDIKRRHTGGKPPKYDPSQLLALYREGGTDREIGDAVGAVPRTICSWRQRNGLPPNVPQGGQKGKVKDPSPVCAPVRDDRKGGK